MVICQTFLTKGSDNMTLTNDDVMILSDMFSNILDRKLVPINQRLDAMDRRFDAIDQRLDAMDRRFDAMDQRLDSMDKRFDRIENRLDVIEFKQNKMSEQLKEIDARQKLFEVHTNKKIAKLQDGIDTVVEILRLHNMVPV